MTSGLVKGNFGDLDGFAGALVVTIDQIQREMDAMAQAAGISGNDWADGGSGQFTDVHEAWRQVSARRQELVDLIRGGVQSTSANLQTALHQSIARIGSTTIA